MTIPPPWKRFDLIAIDQGELVTNSDKKKIEDLDIDPTIRALLPVYLSRRLQDLETLSDLLEEDNYSDIRRLGHNMKGSGAAYGLPEITDIGAALEQAAQASQKKNIVDQIEALRVYVAGFDFDPVDDI